LSVIIIIQEFIIFSLSLIGLYYGAKFITDGAAGIAKAAGISEFVIGATIVAFGTSLPELAASITAMQTGSGHPGIVIGNVLGSNLANIGLGIGLVAILYQMPLYRTSVYDDVILVIGSSMVLFAALIDLEISRWEGLMMLALYAAYIHHNIHHNISEPKPAGQQAKVSFQALSIALLAGGGILVYASSNHLIASLLQISAFTGMGEEVIAFLLLALGTSIPEISTSMVATKRGLGNIAMGNILGSIGFNNLVIPATASFFGDLVIGNDFVSHVPLAVILSILLLGLMALNDRVITRLEGIMLLVVYILVSVNVI
jgi:cation:H+ antiporter